VFEFIAQTADYHCSGAIGWRCWGTKERPGQRYDQPYEIDMKNTMKVDWRCCGWGLTELSVDVEKLSGLRVQAYVRLHCRPR
jgi:hypothetical protein